MADQLDFVWFGSGQLLSPVGPVGKHDSHAHNQKYKPRRLRFKHIKN